MRIDTVPERPSRFRPLKSVDIAESWLEQLIGAPFDQRDTIADSRDGRMP